MGSRRWPGAREGVCLELRLAILHILPMPPPWSQHEIDAALADYFAMLTDELAGHRYNKAEHNRQLRERLDDRSHGSVERKHQNISAILVELELPYIDGYKPLFNYQRELRETVAAYLEANSAIVSTYAEIARSCSEQEADAASLDNVLVDPPERAPASPERTERPRIARQYDFAGMDARNSRLGHLGEQFVLRFETARLTLAGHADLASAVEWVSQTQGDGAGYDIGSFDAAGEPRFIEVKTTNYGRAFPFFISSGELEFSCSNADRYSLYRVFNYRRGPRLFMLPGSVNQHCIVEPQNYRASFGSRVA